MRSKLKDIEKAFAVAPEEMKKIIGDFHSEMDAGLSGGNSSLKMIPAYVTRPTGSELGRFIAIDLGGTNFRILELELKGRRRITKPVSKKFVLDKRYLTGNGKDLFDFIAGCVKIFLKEKKMGNAKQLDLGFTFSFPVEQTGVASGRLLRWTKGFSAEGVIGEDVGALLNEALAGKSVNNVKVAALANDTVGTMAARAYEDPDCDIGVILGTGTNACYAEDISNIRKWQGGATRARQMIVNIEWGNFNRLKTTPYDAQLDRESENPNSQILEKMVSGMYLGELARLIIRDLVEEKMLFNGISSRIFDERLAFKTEYMSQIESDHSGNLSKVAALFKKMRIKNFTLNDRRLCRKVCEIISSRASRISAAGLAAVVTKIDPGISRAHTIAIDGSVYEKYPEFSKHMASALREIFGDKASRIRMTLVKDGSGKGAAVIAAVASSA